MADGRSHARAAFLVLAAGGAGWALGQVPGPVLGGLALGWMVTPDIDLPGTTYEEERVYRLRLGCLPIGLLLGLAWEWYWFPYARIVPHRSPWSHLPGLGTAARLLYLALPYLVYGWAFGFPWWDWGVVLQVWAGMAVQDTVHLVLDAVRF